MQNLNQIRKNFLDFFASKGHQIVSSSPLVPHNDPTLMFTNAGMVQFKDVFTQNETRNYKTAVTSQKCVRAGGKHNDLDNVGYTARHHTFFEMLGNFSFGDYFKEMAIKYAWEFLTEVLELPKEKLLVTIYHNDEDAYKIWRDVLGFSSDKIIRIATKDNFWAMGDTGPCGPCSEIFYDHGDKVFGGPPGSKDSEGDRFIEIWNLVFMQYEALPSGEQIKLPAPSIDTGMGLERLAAILQNVHDNYDIDLFENLINASSQLIKGSRNADPVSHRVIADHLRSMSFLIADGVMPANEGRGYVLRRIMRRAMRHARQLGAKEPVIFELVSALIQQMGDFYPELIRAKSLITETIKMEEKRFGETLDRGLKFLNEATDKIGLSGVLSGEAAFKLYDTYGFPLDLTIDILRSKNIKVDESGFGEQMNEQKKRARAAWSGSGEKLTNEIWYQINEDKGATEFLGYELIEAQATIEAIIVDNKIVDKIVGGQNAVIILNQTPFYAESGGQEGDRGRIFIDKQASFQVSDTKKMLGRLHAHFGKLEYGELKIGGKIHAQIDKNRRDKLRANHSATHILHAVLRKILGDHVTQKGSLVAEDRLRFDFSHNNSLSQDQIEEIENIVNNIIRQNSNVGTKLMTPDEAIKNGAMALFGEKYGDEVRVVGMGFDEASLNNYSVELCGGTHIKATGDIGLFKIISQAAVAAGIRRIEALTGGEALQYINKRDVILQNISGILKQAPEDVVSRIELLLEEHKKTAKEIANLKKQIALSGSSNYGDDKDIVQIIKGINFVAKNFCDVAPKDLRSLVSDMSKQIGSGVVALASSFEGKSSLIVSISDDLVNKISATDCVSSVTELLGAKGGGGKPNFAQTGGTDISRIDEALEVIKAKIP